MGCSNARLLVQTPFGSEPAGGAGANSTNPIQSSSIGTSPLTTATDSHNATTRMHLTGVDLVVERNGSYTLLLTPKTHKQLMPYVLRKKRFRILVDKSRSNLTSPTVTSNEQIVDNERIMESKLNSSIHKKLQDQSLESTIETMEQVASNEFNRTKTRFLVGRSIDRGNPEDENVVIESDDEGMIEEIVTTVEEDKDLECKVKKKIETKKTIAQDPETNSRITKVVKTEVTEITRTITINDEHDLERAKRELGIDDVNRLLPSSRNVTTTVTSSSSMDKSRTTEVKPSLADEKPVLAEATSVGRGPVIETVSSPIVSNDHVDQQEKKKKKKKKSKFCSCTRAVKDEEEQKPTVNIPQPSSTLKSPTVKSVIDTQIQGQALISPEIKQLIVEKKSLLINYVHSQIFSSSRLVSNDDDDFKARKISSRILDLLRYDRCTSWTQMFEQIQEEYNHQALTKQILEPMIKTYENLFTQKQANILNTFSTIHNENDLKNICETPDYLTMAQNDLNKCDDKPSISPIVEASGEVRQDIDKSFEQETSDEKVIDEEQNMVKEIPTMAPIYNEEQLIKMLADVSQHKPITLAEAIAYRYIDIEDPKLGLSYDTVQRVKNLFRPITNEENLVNFIRIQRSGEYFNEINLAENNPLEKFHETSPLICQLQQSFEPTLDFNEKQFRALIDAILNHKEQYEEFQFEISQTSLPVYDLKESSTNEFSQSDSGYSMTTATYESLASKIKIEFEPINQELSIDIPSEEFTAVERIDLDKATNEELEKYQLNADLIQLIKSDFKGTEKTIGQAILSRELRLETADSIDLARLKAFGIDKKSAEILDSFFFPKKTRIIAYSPEPGRFVEAQTSYDAEKPKHKVDTTIIQIEEKQLSSDPLAVQRTNVSPTSEIESSPKMKKEKTPPPTPIYIKKRKTTSGGNLFSCFKSKKVKASNEQQGLPTIAAEEKNLVTTTKEEEKMTTTSTGIIQEKPLIDYAMTLDGKRIYIDAFRDRPGMDMSYRPNDFDERFVLPSAKSSTDYERSMTPETESTVLKSEVTDDKSSIPIHIESIEESSFIHPEPIDEKSEIIQEENIVPIQSSTPTVPLIKKKIIDLHPPVVELPEVQMVQPTLTISKRKKSSSGNLCASCFGKKSAEKKKKINETAAEPIKKETEMLVSPAPQQENSNQPTTNVDDVQKTDEQIEQDNRPSTSIFSMVNIDTFRERTFGNVFQSKSTSNKIEEKSPSPIEQSKPIEEARDEAKLISPTPHQEKQIDESIFSRVNIDTFRERTFDKNHENVSKPSDSSDIRIERVLVTEETIAVVQPVPSPVSVVEKDTSIFSQVNIDTFRERTFDKTIIAKTPEPEEEKETIQEQVPTVVVETKIPSKPTGDDSVYSRVNIDTFRERTFPKYTEKSKVFEEPHYQTPSGELVSSSANNSTEEKTLFVTYDTPRSIELQQTTSTSETLTKDSINQMTSQSKEVEKGTGDFRPIETSPTVGQSDGKEKRNNKKKKTKRTLNLFSTLFRSSDRQRSGPALDLPKVDLAATGDNATNYHQIDPLRVPAVNLPTVDVPLPTYNRPEVNFNVGQRVDVSEFTVPIIEPAPIENLHLPETEKIQLNTLSTAEMMKIPTVDLPELKFTSTENEQTPLIEQNSSIPDPEIVPVQSETNIAQPLTIEEKYTITAPSCIETNESPMNVESGAVQIQVPVLEKENTTEATINIENKPIETKFEAKKKSTVGGFCSCLGQKSTKSSGFQAPKTILPDINAPLPTSKVSSLLKTSEALHVPNTDLPTLDLTAKSADPIRLPSLTKKEKKISKNTNEVIQTGSSSIVIKEPVINIPSMDVNIVSSNKDEIKSINEPNQSRSDSGLEAIISSHIHSSSTFDTNPTLELIQQHPSVSSGFISETVTTPKQFTPSTSDNELLTPISFNDEICSFLTFKKSSLKKSLALPISQSIENFKDRKSLENILNNAIESIRTRQVQTYGALQDRLIVKYKDKAFLANPIVRSLHFAIEKQGLNNLEKDDFQTSLGDMLRLPNNVETSLNKDIRPLEITSTTKETPMKKSRSCFTCSSREKSKATNGSAGLLDERHRSQLNTHRNQLADIIGNHIQSAEPPIRKFPQNEKEIDKIVRKTLTMLGQTKFTSFEQIRDELKNEHKQNFYLVDPIVDIVRDTIEHCDITQMSEKTNLDILNSNVCQTSQTYNRQKLLVNPDELKSSSSWLPSYLTEQESKEKKPTRNLNKQLNRIVTRAVEILSFNVVNDWDELRKQLRREFPKNEDLCQRGVDLLRDAHKNGLFALNQAPTNDLSKKQRRPSTLITERAKKNLQDHRLQIIISLKNLFESKLNSNADERSFEQCLTKTLDYLAEHKAGQFRDYDALKEQLSKDFPETPSNLIGQMVDVIEQAHAANEFFDIDKPEVQTLLKDRLNGKPLIIKEVFVPLPPRIGTHAATNDDSTRSNKNAVNGDPTNTTHRAGPTTSHRITRGLSWREANERARILFYRGKHPAIHYDEQASAFDVRMLLETSEGTREIPVTDTDIHELLNSCGVQWDGVNIISLVDHSDDVVRAAEQAALKVIREKGLVDLRTPPTTRDIDNLHDDDVDGLSSPSS